MANTEGTGASPNHSGDLLARWLSAAESQLCALEVLSTQIPKVNNLLFDNMSSISRNFVDIAEELRVLAVNVEKTLVASRELDLGQGREKKTIHGALRDMLKIVHKSDVSNAAETLREVEGYIHNLQGAALEQSESLSELLEEAQSTVDLMQKGVSTVIMGMQFQDRVAQNLVIAENVVNSIGEYLQRNIEATLAESSREDSKGVLDIVFAKQMIGFLTLGELQRQFVDHLLEHNYIKQVEELGLENVDAGKADDVELF